MTTIIKIVQQRLLQLVLNGGIRVSTASLNESNIQEQANISAWLTKAERRKLRI